jgi:photosystem II stability/assembly factor-like uncharacterized protein
MKRVYLFLIMVLISNGHLYAQAGSGKNFYEISREQNDYYNRVGKDKPGYKQFKRWEWYYSTRMGEGGLLVDNHQLKQNAVRRISANRPHGTGSADVNTGGWTQVGPTFVNSADKGIGRANRIAFHPSNPNILYVAGATGGLWISSDAGQNWFSYSEGIPNMALSGVAVDYTNTNIIYILTGDADDSGGGGQMQFGKPSIGILKSYDGGFTWYQTGLSWNETDNRLGYKLMIHPTNPLILLVATNDGIYRTTNGGTTWSQVHSGLKVYDMEFHPTNPAIVYASGTDASNIRVLKSTDNGQTFTETHSLTRVNNADGNSSANRSALAVSAANSSYVYLLTGPATAAGEFHGFYRSTDIGESFTLRTNTPNLLGNTSSGGDKKDQEGYDMAAAVSPTNINVVACGGIRLWTSTNGGTGFTWQDDNASATSYYHPDIHDLSYHPLNSSILYMCGDGGIYRSNDNGDNWTHLNNNLQLTQYYKISINPTNSAGNQNVIIGGTQDNGTNKRSIAGGGTFSQILGADGMDCYIDPDNTNRYVASVQNGKFYYSADAGSSFEVVCDESSLSGILGVTVRSSWVTPVSEITGNSTQFVMGYQPVVLATRISTGVYAYTQLGWSGHSFVKTARGNADRIYVGDNAYGGSQNNLVKTTTNLGTNWSDVYSGNHNGRPVTDLAFAPNNGSRMWLTFGGFGAVNKVLYSGNGGDNGGSWTDITGSLPAVPINCIVYDPNGTSIDAIYIGTDIGVFYRDNNLGDWMPFRNGLPVVEVTDLEIHPTEGLLRAGTYGRGIWETSLYSSCPANITLNTSNTAMYMPYYFQASQTISSTAMHIGAGANVFYKAGTALTLSPGFIGAAGGGNVFEAAVGPCGGGVPSRTEQRPVHKIKGMLVE